MINLFVNLFKIIVFGIKIFKSVNRYEKKNILNKIMVVFSFFYWKKFCKKEKWNNNKKNLRYIKKSIVVVYVVC